MSLEFSNEEDIQKLFYIDSDFVEYISQCLNFVRYRQTDGTQLIFYINVLKIFIVKNATFGRS